MRLCSVKIPFLAFLISLFSSVCFANLNSDVVNLPVRDEVTENYLLTWEDSGIPTSAVFLFSGDNGMVGISKLSDTVHLAVHNNFLVRSRDLFVDEHTLSVVIDTPSDNPNGMTDTFRRSTAHFNDLSKIIDDVKARFPGIKIYFVGTSRGTMSAAYAGDALQSKINGIILTSTYTLKDGIGDFHFQSIKLPMLLFHHIEDSCKVSPYSEALRISKKYKIPLVTVHGGDEPISKPCQALSQHGFLGKEKEVASEILNWINQKPIKENI